MMMYKSGQIFLQMYIEHFFRLFKRQNVQITPKILLNAHRHINRFSQ